MEQATPARVEIVSMIDWKSRKNICINDLNKTPKCVAQQVYKARDINIQDSFYAKNKF